MNTKLPVIGQTYTGTIAKMTYRKRRGGYYTGYEVVPSGQVAQVTCRADDHAGDTFWGEWVEIRGPYRNVRQTFTEEMFSRLIVETK